MLIRLPAQGDLAHYVLPRLIHVSGHAQLIPTSMEAHVRHVLLAMYLTRTTGSAAVKVTTAPCVMIRNASTATTLMQVHAKIVSQMQPQIRPVSVTGSISIMIRRTSAIHVMRIATFAMV